MTTTTYFSLEQLELIDKTRVPRHIAIIPDGNRRWAKKLSEQPQRGHQEGANVLIETVKAAKELGIKALTFYLFSTENWNRPKEEIAALMWLLQEFLREQCPEMQSHGVRLKTIGDLSVFAENVLDAIEKTSQATSHCKDIDMIMALNYGGRDDMKRAIHRIIDDCSTNKLRKENVTEAVIASYLDTAPWGDPDLFIRTSGERRISNFLLWQLSYAEIYVTNILWPDFMPKDLLDAVIDYQRRERRLGGT